MRLYGILRNYYGIENRYPIEKNTVVIFGRRLIRHTLHSAPMTIFSWAPNSSQGPNKCAIFVQKKEPVWVMSNRTVSMATHYTILNNKGIHINYISACVQHRETKLVLYESLDIALSSDIRICKLAN